MWLYVGGGDNLESYVAFCSWIPNSISFCFVWHYVDAEPMVNGVGGEGQEEETIALSSSGRACYVFSKPFHIDKLCFGNRL